MSLCWHPSYFVWLVVLVNGWSTWLRFDLNLNSIGSQIRIQGDFSFRPALTLLNWTRRREMKKMAKNKIVLQCTVGPLPLILSIWLFRSCRRCMKPVNRWKLPGFTGWHTQSTNLDLHADIKQTHTHTHARTHTDTNTEANVLLTRALLGSSMCNVQTQVWRAEGCSGGHLPVSQCHTRSSAQIQATLF